MGVCACVCVCVLGGGEDGTYQGNGGTEKKHDNKAGSVPSKTSLLKFTTETIQEEHVEHERDSHRTKEHETCHQTPYLVCVCVWGGGGGGGCIDSIVEDIFIYLWWSMYE